MPRSSADHLPSHPKCFSYEPPRDKDSSPTESTRVNNAASGSESHLKPILLIDEYNLSFLVG